MKVFSLKQFLERVCIKLLIQQTSEKSSICTFCIKKKKKERKKNNCVDFFKIAVLIYATLQCSLD